MTASHPPQQFLTDPKQLGGRHVGKVAGGSGVGLQRVSEGQTEALELLGLLVALAAIPCSLAIMPTRRHLPLRLRQLAQADEVVGQRFDGNSGLLSGFEVDNAEDMTLPTASFDLVFGSGILHHLALEVSLKEIQRVLRPAARRSSSNRGATIRRSNFIAAGPAIGTVDEHPLLKSDFDIVRKYFSKCEPHSSACRPWRHPVPVEQRRPAHP